MKQVYKAAVNTQKQKTQTRIAHQILFGGLPVKWMIDSLFLQAER